MAAEWIDAEEAVDLGLAMEILPAENLLPHVMGQAEKLALLPLASLVKTKSLIMEPVKAQMKHSIKNENIGLDQLRGSPANLEAINAFREKREPDFNNC